MIVPFDRARRAPAAVVSRDKEAELKRSRAAHPSACGGPTDPARRDRPKQPRPDLDQLPLVTGKAS